MGGDGETRGHANYMEVLGRSVGADSPVYSGDGSSKATGRKPVRPKPIPDAHRLPLKRPAPETEGRQHLPPDFAPWVKYSVLRRVWAALIEEYEVLGTVE